MTIKCTKNFWIKYDVGMNFCIIKADKSANNMLHIGPAIATNAMSVIGSLKFLGSTGTGFAYPIRKWDFAKNNPNGIKKDP